jgi:RNA polymerase sigma-70 factor (ECF subfamily)
MVEGALIWAARAGSRLAKGELVQRFGPRVWALCRRLDPDPEDAYQATWERILVHIDRFEPAGEGSFGGWVTRICHRLLVDRHRRRMVRAGPSWEELGEENGEVVAGEVEDQQVMALDGRRLELALLTLPEALRRVVVLHHVFGLELEEIAQTEGVPVGTLKSRLFRARVRLAQCLSEVKP